MHDPGPAPPADAASRTRSMLPSTSGAAMGATGCSPLLPPELVGLPRSSDESGSRRFMRSGPGLSCGYLHNTAQYGNSFKTSSQESQDFTLSE